mmetsp:Transcript_21234/g.86849  ORF Transcript_21234/g.86849 Transcript_21234/m.86849 type:complete len:119 (+) Transcript_21234:175-531(+)
MSLPFFSSSAVSSSAFKDLRYRSSSSERFSSSVMLLQDGRNIQCQLGVMYGWIVVFHGRLPLSLLNAGIQEVEAPDFLGSHPKHATIVQSLGIFPGNLLDASGQRSVVVPLRCVFAFW